MKTNTDYGYCNDCKTYFDLWKYDDIESTGHENCDWRFVNDTELKTCIQECIEDDCFITEQEEEQIRDGLDNLEDRGD